MEKSMDWTLEDDMVDGLFCATLTGLRGGHTPFVQAGAESPDTGAEAVMPNPRCPWQGHSWRVSAGFESTEPRSVVQPLRTPLVIRPERRTSVVVCR